MEEKNNLPFPAEFKILLKKGEALDPASARVLLNKILVAGKFRSKQQPDSN